MDLTDFPSYCRHQKTVQYVSAVNDFMKERCSIWKKQKQAGETSSHGCVLEQRFKEPRVSVWDITSLFLTVGTSTTGFMSTSRSNGQPQSWQAVNQSDYRKPLVQGYTIKSGNGLIKPATPQQTFWFCLLRAARSRGWVKIRKPFFFCALLPGVSCPWSMYSKMHCAESYLFTPYSSWVNIRGEHCD